MLSESARMSSAQEARFRVQYPNSRERAIKVVALDPAAAAILAPISKGDWHGAKFFTSLNFAAAGAPSDGLGAWLKDVAGQTMNLISEVEASDFVVVVTCVGEDARAVSVIADACKLHHKSLLALVVPHEDAKDEDITASLKDLRPYAKMLVIASGVDYIETMLTALRA